MAQNSELCKFHFFQPFNSSLQQKNINPLNAELNPICHLLALLGSQHILHIGRIRVKIYEYTEVVPQNDYTFCVFPLT